MTNSLLPKFTNGKDKGLFIACAASVLAAHTAIWAAKKKIQAPDITNLYDSSEWMNALDNAILYDAALLTPAVGAYAYYQWQKTKPDT